MEVKPMAVRGKGLRDDVFNHYTLVDAEPSGYERPVKPIAV